jgi:hypothetical protein
MSNNALNKNRFMAKMRFRLFDMLKANPEFPQSGAMAGRLALLAGTLTTARRLLGLDGETRNELLHLLKDILAYLTTFFDQRRHRCRAVDLLYLLRVRNELEVLPRTEFDLKQEIDETLRASCQSAWGTSKWGTLLSNAILSALSGQEFCALEWLRISKFGVGLDTSPLGLSRG